mgnify:CR=1 FL=1
MNKSVFEKYSDYYDLIYKEKDYKSEAIYIHNLINRYTLYRSGVCFYSFRKIEFKL